MENIEQVILDFVEKEELFFDMTIEDLLRKVMNICGNDLSIENIENATRYIKIIE